jgi:uncharacterized protein
MSNKAPIKHFTVRFSVCTVIILLTLAWSSVAFCGEIHDAAKSGDLARVKSMLLANPNLALSMGSYDWTPLHYAAYNGDRAMAELLLANGADVNAKDYFSGTPLHQAVMKAHKAMVEFLLAKGANVNAKDKSGDTPLHMAAMYKRHKEVAELLLSKGADVNAKNDSGYTPLRYAKVLSTAEMRELLLQRGGHE